MNGDVVSAGESTVPMPPNHFVVFERCRTPYENDRRLPAGTYELTVVKDGYRPNTQQVELGAADELVSRLVIVRRPGTRGRRRWPGRKPKGRAAAPKGAVKAVKSGPVTPAGKVKVHVLDEETSREFGIKPSGGRKPVKKPSIELLD